MGAQISDALATAQAMAPSRFATRFQRGEDAGKIVCFV
jgi:hypothetical protein